MANEVFIPINRTKMLMMAIAFSVIGLLSFLVVYYYGESQEWTDPVFFKVASVVVLLFFGVVAGTFGKNLRNREAGLYISRKGIDDQSSSIGHGLVSWKDIKRITPLKAGTTYYLLIFVKKPNVFVENAKNAAVKRLLNQNVRLYKTPVVINLGALSVSLDELEKTIVEFGGKWGK